MIKTVPNPIAPTLHQPLHSKVSNYLNDQRRQSGQYCDLIIELENADNGVYAHFCVVAAQSRFIGGSQFLQQSLQFSIHNPLKVTIRDFPCAQCLQTIVDFFYEDVVVIAKDHEQHFRKLAKLLVVTELLNLFEMQEESTLSCLEQGGVGLPTSDTACIERDHQLLDAAATLAEAEKRGDVNLGIDNIFDDSTYFKLKNPRAANSSSKINYCIGCDFKCYRVHDMISHMSACEASHLTCSLCEVGFLGWREYDAHLRKHSADAKKPFFCLDCDARFVTRAALTVQHQPKHSTEAPHTCPHCQKGFKWKHGLRSHLLIHNKEKQMLCDVCGYSTTHMKALKSHKLQHTGALFKCTYAGCTHRANRKENLKLHMETHKQERPFVCEVCGCKFSQSKNLKRHALKHYTGEISKYKCQLCSFGSLRSDKLKEHMQRVHTEKAVLLELPEIVENAFENNVADEFDLPIISNKHSTDNEMERFGESTSKTATPSARKKRVLKRTVERRRERLLAPKGIPSDHTVKSFNPFNI